MLLRGPALFALGALGALCAFYQVRSYDTFFHLAAGRYIVEQGALPSVDPFSFTFRGHPWRNHSPLAQVLFYLVESGAGFEGLTVLNACLAALVVIVPLLSLRGLGLDPRFGAGLLLLGPVAFRETLVARPHLLGYLALQLGCVALLRHVRGGGWRPLLASLPLYAVWLSIHGSHLLLPILLLTLAVTQAARRRLHDAGQALAAALACGGLLRLLSPEALAQGATHVSDRALETLVPEWQPLTADLLLTPAGLALLTVWLTTLLGAALVHVQGLRGRVARQAAAPQALALTAVLMVVAVTSVRMVPLFLIGAAPLWLPLASLALGRLLVGVWRRLRRGWRPVAALAPPVLATACVLITAPTGARFGWGLQRDRVPIGAVDHLATHGRVKRIYNAYNYGGYLMYRGIPEEGVFIDGRAITLYPPEFMQAFDAAYDDPRLFDLLARRYRVDGVLMPSDSRRTPRLIAHLRRHPAWQPTYADAHSVLFELQAAPRPVTGASR